jgi:hypothetical protein
MLAKRLSLQIFAKYCINYEKHAPEGVSPLLAIAPSQSCSSTDPPSVDRSEAWLSIVVDGDNLLTAIHDRDNNEQNLEFDRLLDWIVAYYTDLFGLCGQTLRLGSVEFFLTVMSQRRKRLAKRLSARGYSLHVFGRDKHEAGYRDSQVAAELDLHGHYYDAVCLISSDGDFRFRVRDLQSSGVRVGSVAIDYKVNQAFWPGSYDDAFLLHELAEINAQMLVSTDKMQRRNRRSNRRGPKKKVR